MNHIEGWCLSHEVSEQTGYWVRCATATANHISPISRFFSPIQKTPIRGLIDVLLRLDVIENRSRHTEQIDDSTKQLHDETDSYYTVSCKPTSDMNGDPIVHKASTESESY